MPGSARVHVEARAGGRLLTVGVCCPGRFFVVLARGGILKGVEGRGGWLEVLRPPAPLTGWPLFAGWGPLRAGGLDLVQRCTQRGFHMHPPTETGQPIYELCGHVYLNPRCAYEVVDLRA